MICLCPSFDVDSAWQHVWPLLKPAVERSLGRDTEEALKAELANGHYQLWMAGSIGELYGACATRVGSFPSGKKVLEIMALGGKDFDAWSQELINTLDKFSSINYCESIRFWGRRGWARKAKTLASLGFSDTGMVELEKKIVHG